MAERFILTPSKATPFTLINHVISCLNQDFDLHTNLERALLSLVEYFEVKNAIALIQTNSGRLVPRASVGVGADTLSELQSRLHDPHNSIAYDVLDQLEPHFIADLRNDGLSISIDAYIERQIEVGIRSVLFIPMLDAYSACGVIVLHSIEPDHVREIDLELMLAIGRQFALAIDRFAMMNAEREAIHQADVLREIRTICWCGRKATMVVRLGSDGRILEEGGQVEIGGEESYVSLCRRHWEDRDVGPNGQLRIFL